MDHARSEAIKALFSKGVEPDQSHVEELKKNPRLLADEEDNLFDVDNDAFNNFKAFSNEAATYIATLKISRQKVLIQRLAGLPEDPMPEDPIEPIPNADDANPPPAPKQVAGLVLGNLDDLVLDDETPATTTKEVAAEAEPTQAPKPDQTPSQKNTRHAGESVVLNLDVPYWIRALHATERWQQTRPLVEEVFAQSRHSDPVVRSNGQERLNAWKQHAKECSEGCCGIELVAFGERLLKVIRSLENGADPTSHAYQVFYINT